MYHKKVLHFLLIPIKKKHILYIFYSYFKLFCSFRYFQTSCSTFLFWFFVHLFYFLLFIYFLSKFSQKKKYLFAKIISKSTLNNTRSIFFFSVHFHYNVHLMHFRVLYYVRMPLNAIKKDQN